MVIKINKPIMINVKFVKFNIPVRSDAFCFHEDDIETIKNNLNCAEVDFNNETRQFSIVGIVDIESGKFINWKQTTHEIEIFEKVVDGGTYSMYSDNNEEIASYNGYVPSIFECNENGYGDYFNMTIQPDGTINNWDKNMESKINGFLEKYEVYG